MSINVGSASVTVTPDARNFNKDLAAQINPGAKATGDALGRQLADQIAAGIRKGLGDWPTTPPAGAPRSGAAAGGAFADAFKARVKAALADLPDVKLGADASEADRKLAEIRAELADLASKRIGIDLSDADALAKLDELRARLDRLNAESSSVQVKTDTARASADLAKFQLELDKINGETATANVKVDDKGSTSQATQGITSLWGAVAMLTPALIPVAGAAAAGGMALVSMAAAGVGAVGVLAIALASVGNAVKLLGQQQTQQAAADQQAGQQAAARAMAITAASRQEQSAAMSLADARRAAATQQVQDAQAVQTAQYGVVQAAQKVQSAQYSLAQADQAEQNAITALTNAREAATRALQSAANNAVDARLAERQAVLDLETAQKNYAIASANGTLATQAGQQVALDLQKAQQRLTETQQAATIAAQDNTKAQKAGVDGSAQVISAHQAVAAAQHGVIAAAQGVKDAQHGQQQAAQALANAQKKAATDQITAQESVVRAEQGVAAASDAMAAAQRNAAGQTNAALAATNKQVAALDPATRAFAQYLRSDWLPIWHQVQAAATGGLLPGLQAGMEAVRPQIPLFTGIIHNLASTMGDLFKQAGQALGDPFWTKFFTMIRQDAGPLLADLGHTIGGVVTGFAGIISAFMPMSLQIGGGIDGLAQKFSAWGQNLSTSQGFRDFTDYVKSTWPQVRDTVENVATVVGHLVTGLSGIGGPELEILKTFSGILASLPVPVVTAMATAFAGFKIGSTIAGPIASLGGALSKMGAAESVTGGIAKVAGALPGVGLALGVIGPLVPMFLDFLAGTPKIADRAAKSVQAIADAIDATNGKIDESVRKSVALQIQQLGLADGASKWGLSVKDLVDAATGVPGAMDKVTAAAKLTDRQYDNLIKSGGDANGMLNAAKAKADDEYNALLNLAGGVDGTVKKNKELTTAVYGSVDAQKAMQGASDTLTNAVVKSGVTVSATWDANTAVLDSATAQQIATLKGLGEEVVQLPNGKVVVTSDTGPARDALNQLIKDYKDRQLTIAAGNFGPAAARLTSAQNAGGTGYAAGGWTGPGSKYTPAGIVHANEFVVPSERVNALGGPASVGTLVGMPGYASGGPVAPFNMYEPMAAGLSAAAMEQARAIISHLLPAAPVAPASGGVERLRPIVDNVLRMLGQSTSLDNGVLSLIQNESGGQSAVVNRWDSNWLAGHPSVGDMQVIAGTFARYAGPFRNVGPFSYGVSTNDTANIYAGVNYALQNYGAGMLAAGGRHSAPGHYIGYDAGGNLPPGPSLVYNGTGADEIVAPKHTFEQIMNGSTGGSSRPTFHVDMMVVPDKQHPAETAEQLAFLARTRG